MGGLGGGAELRPRGEEDGARTGFGYPDQLLFHSSGCRTPASPVLVVHCVLRLQPDDGQA